MVTNPLFSNYLRPNEQKLVESLITESIQLHGINVYYVPQIRQTLDKFYKESDQQSYTTPYLIEMYLKNYLDFKGDREFMSKFSGLNIQDKIIFTVSQRRFAEDIGSVLNTTRPMEGDIIYLEPDRRAFIIRYVNKYEFPVYQLGKLYTWELTCDLFEYSGETFNTGIEDLDRLQNIGSTNILTNVIKDTDGIPLAFEDGTYWAIDGFDFATVDPLSVNDEVQTRAVANTYVDFSETDPFDENGNLNVI